MAEAMNKCFQGVFREENVFDEPPGSGLRGPCLNNIEFTVSDLVNEIENLDVRKFQSLDGASNWVLKKCSKQLAGKIQGHRKFPGRGCSSYGLEKKADTVPISKSGRNDEPLNYRLVSLTSVKNR